MASLSGKAVVAGIGETPYTTNSGMHELELQLTACMLAIEDAGISPKEIDCLIPGVEGFNADIIADNLGIRDLKFNAKTYLGGGQPAGAIALSAMLFEAGMASMTLFYNGYNGRSQAGWGRADRVRRPVFDTTNRDFSRPFGMMAPSHSQGLMARRRMHEYGITSRQAGAYAVAARKHANMNDNAVMKGRPITIEDHQNSRMINDPLHLLDVCLETDGAAAFLVTTPEKARNMKQTPVYLLGCGISQPYLSGTYSIQRPDINEHGTRLGGERAFEMAGVTRKDIDFACISDPMSFTLILQLELLGFCKDGEGGEFIQGGRIEVGGELPVNTHGGVHSQAHLGYTNHYIEAVRQLRHEAGVRQVQGAEIGLVCGWGEGETGGVVILGR